MNYWQALFSAEYFSALLLIALLQPLLIWRVAKLTENTDGGPFYETLMDIFGYPLAHSGLTLLFMILAYPVLFGISAEQNYPDIFSADDKSLSNLFNILIFLGLFLPLLPIIGAFKGLVLALQIIIASQVLLHWSLSGIGGDVFVQYIPSPASLFKWLIMSLILQWLATTLGALFGGWIDEKAQLRGCATLCETGLSFFLQGFVILAYTLFLGGQIPAT